MGGLRRARSVCVSLSAFSLSHEIIYLKNYIILLSLSVFKSFVFSVDLSDFVKVKLV